MYFSVSNTHLKSNGFENIITSLASFSGGTSSEDGFESLVSSVVLWESSLCFSAGSLTLLEDTTPSFAVSSLSAFHSPDPQLLLLLLIQLFGESLRDLAVITRKFVSTDINFRLAELRRERLFDLKDSGCEGLVASSEQGEIEVRCGGCGDNAGRLLSDDLLELEF